MRQAQQNRRGRGRARKPQNPLSRSYESNGPDVKIRGTAAHIAEKYITLGRDAHANGDPVTAENYYQHAEHYNRIIASAQAQMQPGQQGQQEASAQTNNRNRAGQGEQPVVEADDWPNEQANSRSQGERGERSKSDNSNNESKNDGDGAAAATTRPRRRRPRAAVNADGAKASGDGASKDDTASNGAVAG